LSRNLKNGFITWKWGSISINYGRSTMDDMQPIKDIMRSRMDDIINGAKKTMDLYVETYNVLIDEFKNAIDETVKNGKKFSWQGLLPWENLVSYENTAREENKESYIIDGRGSSGPGRSVMYVYGEDHGNKDERNYDIVNYVIVSLGINNWFAYMRDYRGGSIGDVEIRVSNSRTVYSRHAPKREYEGKIFDVGEGLIYPNRPNWGNKLSPAEASKSVVEWVFGALEYNSKNRTP